jgi:hypothetical protein
MWRSSAVLRQVPMIEQCRLTPNSQMRVRTAIRPAASSTRASGRAAGASLAISRDAGRGAGAACSRLVDSRWAR